MIHEDFNMREHNFVGHLAEPDQGSDKAVIVIMGGEQSLFPGIKIAERFADYGIVGLSVSLFGADGLPEGPDRCPIDVFEYAVNYLRDAKKISHISTYGQSMGSIFAVLVAEYIGGIENVIMVSPTHVPFEGTLKDKKHMSGHSVATWRGRDIPYVTADFSKMKAGKYLKHPAAAHKVTGMWVAYYEAYQDKDREQKAWLPIEKTNARVLLIAGGADEAWPAEYSVNVLKSYLERKNYTHDFKAIVYPNVSHLTGMMPNKEREKKLYRLIPLIGFMYKSFGKHKKECMEAFAKSEEEIINWLSA
ncbi:MAG: acyl-CoA thioester hydrolase/BAAT C-terminal domain-containing protein [Lachnospiraceae bacterium]|nr:acyl-CoA thioester hydrolase/BAAT C-terminal domain-containing protein [Lachnospiraceae bacterium]